MTNERNPAAGLVETRGIVALTAGIEAMLKTADVEIVSVERISSGYLAASISGSVAAVRQALDAGSAAISQYGELRSARLYPQPHPIATSFLAVEGRAELARGTDGGALEAPSSEAR